MDFKNVVYLAGFVLSYAYDDLSFHKLANQLHTSFGPSGLYTADNAVDNETMTCTRTIPIGRNSGYKAVWWKVDLGRLYNIYSIDIIFKSYEEYGYEDRQRGRFAGFSLYVSNTDVSTTTGIMYRSTLCYKNGPQLPSLNFTTTCTGRGRYVIFYNERLNGVTYPKEYEIYNVYTELCEVIVQGCNRSDMYGSNCDHPCPINCEYNTCHIENGTCFGCKPGWIGTFCDIICTKGFYGDNCSNHCAGHCRDNAICNYVTGHCARGCSAGWAGPLCEKECGDGTFGYECVNKCSGHCLDDSPCNKQTGHCGRGCNPGYTNKDCGKQCGSGLFGLNCSDRCSIYCMNNDPCNHISGYCPRGCMDGYFGGHCNNSCQPGYYGTNCSLPCSPNCKTCRHTDGLCSCKAGWRGHYCTIECTESYGENCQYPCGLHCINQTCDPFSGNCLCDGKYDSLRDIKTTDVASSTFWIVVFFISLFINIVFTSATLISRRKTFLKQKSEADKVNFSWRSGSNTEQTVTTDDPSLYQDLRVSNDENTYQTLHQQ